MSVPSSNRIKPVSSTLLPAAKVKPAITTMDKSVLNLVLVFLSKKEIAYLYYTNRSFFKDIDRIWLFTARSQNILLIEVAPGKLVLPAKEQILQHIEKINSLMLTMLSLQLPRDTLLALNSERKNPLHTISKIKKWLTDNTQTKKWGNIFVAGTVCRFVENSLNPLQTDSAYGALGLIFKAVKQWQSFSPCHERHRRDYTCCDPLGFRMPIKGCFELQQMVVQNQLIGRGSEEDGLRFKYLISSLLENPIASEDRCKLIALLLESSRILGNFKEGIRLPFQAKEKKMANYVRGYRWLFITFIENYTFPQRLPLENLKLLLQHCPEPVIYKEIYNVLDKVVQRQAPDYINLLAFKAQCRRGYEILEIITDVLNIKIGSEYYKMSLIGKQFPYPSCLQPCWCYVQDYVFVLKLAESPIDNIMQILKDSKHVTASDGQLDEIRRRLHTVSDAAVHEKQLEEIHEKAKKLIQAKIDVIPKKNHASCIIM